MRIRRSTMLLVLLGTCFTSQSFAAGEVLNPLAPPRTIPPTIDEPPVGAVSPLAPPTPKLSGSADPFEGLLEDFQYDPVGKRDPFAPFSPPKIGTQGMVGPVFPLQRFSIEQLKLQGIIWDVNSPKALVVDPSNRAHIIVKDDRIGQRNGYVAQIREDEVIIVESIDLNGRTIYQTRVLRMVINSEKKQ